MRERWQLGQNLSQEQLKELEVRVTMVTSMELSVQEC